MTHYDSGWTIIGAFVFFPVLAMAILWVAANLVHWSIARGSEYRGGQAHFVGVLPMVGLNMLLPGTGLMAGGFSAQGWACLILWGLVLSTAVEYAALPTRNLTVMHLFAGIWASVVAGAESARGPSAPGKKRESPGEGRLNPHKQRVPTLEDPDLYPVRLGAFQTLLEAARGPDGGFNPAQKAAINRLRGLLRIDDRAFSRLVKQVSSLVDGEASADTVQRHAVEAYESLLGNAIDHPAFLGMAGEFLDSAATLLGIPLREARDRRLAYERGEPYDPHAPSASQTQSLSTSRSQPPLASSRSGAPPLARSTSGPGARPPDPAGLAMPPGSQAISTAAPPGPSPAAAEPGSKARSTGSGRAVAAISRPPGSPLSSQPPRPGSPRSSTGTTGSMGAVPPGGPAGPEDPGDDPTET